MVKKFRFKQNKILAAMNDNLIAENSQLKDENTKLKDENTKLKVENQFLFHQLRREVYENLDLRILLEEGFEL
jgi:cell division protein FtsB